MKIKIIQIKLKLFKQFLITPKLPLGFKNILSIFIKDNELLCILYYEKSEFSI